MIPVTYVIEFRSVAKASPRVLKLQGTRFTIRADMSESTQTRILIVYNGTREIFACDFGKIDTIVVEQRPTTLRVVP